MGHNGVTGRNEMERDTAELRDTTMIRGVSAINSVPITAGGFESWDFLVSRCL